MNGNEINEEAAFADQLQRYDPFAAAVRDSIAQQETLLNGIRVCYFIVMIIRYVAIC